MSALTRRHPTEDRVEVLVTGKTIRRFIGDRRKLRPLLSAIKGFQFHEVQEGVAGSVPWEVLAADRLKLYGKPGLAVRGARAKEGMSQGELARRLNIQSTNLSKMENGSRPIGKLMAKRLAAILKVDYRIFL